MKHTALTTATLGEDSKKLIQIENVYFDRVVGYVVKEYADGVEIDERSYERNELAVATADFDSTYPQAGIVTHL